MFTIVGKSSGGGVPAGNFAPLQTVRGYWEALRRGGAIALRADVDPRGMANCLEHVFLAERIAPGQARFRLAGMHFSDLMGMDMRGMPLSALFDPATRARVAQALEQMYADQSVLEIGVEAERGLGRKALAGRMLLLPVQGNAREPALVLGCFATHGTIGRAPRRFAMTGVMHESLRVTPSVVEKAATVTPSAMRAPQRPWLRLVSTKD
jgi:hypothetical protein